MAEGKNGFLRAAATGNRNSIYCRSSGPGKNNGNRPASGRFFFPLKKWFEKTADGLVGRIDALVLGKRRSMPIHWRSWKRF